MIKVSVIITTYNGSKYIGKCIESILEQKLHDFQLIVVNDGSTDDTENIIKSFSDKRLEYYLTANNGHVGALNYGLSKCKAKLTSIQDHDDIALKDKLYQQYSLFEADDSLGVVGTSYFVIGEGNKVLQKMILPSADFEIKKKMIYRDIICHSGVMYKTELIRKVGGYKKKYSVAADYELWLRLLNKTKFFNIDEPLMLFRKHKYSQTSALEKYENNNHCSLLALEKHKDLVGKEQKYIFAIWQIIYGDVKKGRWDLLKETIRNFQPIKIKTKYLIISIFNRNMISKYYYFNPFRRLFIILTKQ